MVTFTGGINTLHTADVWRMIRRRAKLAGIKTSDQVSLDEVEKIRL